MLFYANYMMNAIRDTGCFHTYEFYHLWGLERIFILFIYIISFMLNVIKDTDFIFTYTFYHLKGLEALFCALYLCNLP